VASGGTQALTGFHPSGLRTAPRPALPAPTRTGGGHPPLLRKCQRPSGHALRPVTTSNASSAMSYRNCWHIFSPRLNGRLSRYAAALAGATRPARERLFGLSPID